jgi:hypothetical protein
VDVRVGRGGSGGAPPVAEAAAETSRCASSGAAPFGPVAFFTASVEATSPGTRTPFVF